MFGVFRRMNCFEDEMVWEVVRWVYIFIEAKEVLVR